MHKKKEGIKMDKNKKKQYAKENEDATKYGEFVSSYFGWITLDGQKEKVEELEKVTKKNKKSCK